MSKQVLAKVIPIDSKRAPKSCMWRLRYVYYGATGIQKYECLVFNYDTGNTAFEAWQLSAFPTNPAFYECTFESLCDYPCPDALTELKIHGTIRRKNGTRTERVSAVIAGQDSRTAPEIPHPSGNSG